MKTLIVFFLLQFGAFCGTVISQVPTPEPSERVVTEEIRLNVSVLDRAGNAAADAKKEDLVIMEDGRLHQAASARPLAPSVLIAMDTGGSMRHKKNIDTTRSAASAVATELRPGTSFAILNFHDRVEQLSGWTTDKGKALDAIAGRTGLGRRSLFTASIVEAEKIFGTAPSENRHLVLITDGLDSVDETDKRLAAIRRLWKSGVAVHVISYTAIELREQKAFGGLIRKGEQNPRRIPDEVMDSLIYAIPVRKIEAREILRQIYQPRLLSVIVDMPYLRAQRSQKKALATAQIQLSVLSEYTGGEFMLPETLEEMVEKAAGVSGAINSQYVVTYIPKRPLIDVKADEIRTVEVTARRTDLDVRSKRKLIIFAPADPK